MVGTYTGEFKMGYPKARVNIPELLEAIIMEVGKKH